MLAESEMRLHSHLFKIVASWFGAYDNSIVDIDDELHDELTAAKAP